MKRVFVISFCLALIAGTSCRRRDIRTIVINVPAMKNRACAEQIVKALGKNESIPPTDILVSLQERTLTVRYDSIQRSMKNLEFAVADIGFDANDVPGNVEARKKLPPECEQ